MANPTEVVSTYILAKDGNRPWLMRRAFTEDAHLEMVVATDAISFPAAATGVGAITDTLVRRFSSDQENVYTICLSSPPSTPARTFSCDWLVGMSRRDNGEVRVGCGRYDWSFAGPDQRLASALKITIDVMQIVAPKHMPQIMSWLSELPYPWCPADVAVRNAPRLDGLQPIVEYLRRRA